MGGGDLNLKKSWHPSTLRNIERVWKAEQMRDQEKAKIEQLQKELQEERNKQEMRQYAENKGVVKKKQERLDWMYQGVAGLVDREQYLLGRKVDKNFEIMKKEEDGVEDKNENEQPGSIFTMAPTNAAVDLENKIREDPLFAIKKQEMKTKKTLLSNPVKMKHLKEMIEQSIKSSKKAHKKKKKKEHKKHKRRSPSVSCSSDSSTDEHDQHTRRSKIDAKRDIKITTSGHRSEKEHSVFKHRLDGASKPRQNSSAHARSRTEKSNTWKDTRLLGRYEKSSNSRTESSRHGTVSMEKKSKRHLSSSPDSQDHREVVTQLKRPVKSSSRSHSKRKRHDSSSSNSSAKDHKHSENSQHLTSPVLESNNHQHDKRPRFGLIVRGDQNRKKERQLPPMKAQPKEPKQNKTAPQATQKRSRPLSEEEKAAARREMMENAQWHDEQRKTIVNRYRKSEAAEERNHHKDIGEGFIRPMLAKAADSGSVENRIKQKMYTVQRSSSAMDVHFARK